MVKDRDLVDAGAAQRFADDLSNISHKHRVIVAGCGCCGSPFLIPMVAYEKMQGETVLEGDGHGYIVNEDGDLRFVDMRGKR